MPHFRPWLCLTAALLLPVPLLAADWLYLTVPGDTLIGIGKEYLNNPNDWPKVQSANKVRIPRHLPVNTPLRIPVRLLKQTPAAVEVTHVQGNVRVKPADGRYRKLAVGDRLTGGETVITGPRSFAGYRLADGSALNQQPRAKLAFGRLVAWGKTGMVATEIDLQSGRLEASAARQRGPAGGFRVKTPVAVAGLRGTAFRLNVAEDGGSLHSEVLEGEVGVAAQGREVGVGAGQGTIALAGKPPEPPRALLPAPAVQGLPTLVDTLPLRFAWLAGSQAAAWRVQVAADPSFTRLVLDDRFDAAAAEWEDAPPDGNYVLRIRGVDDRGLEGLNLDHPFTLDARPLPPMQMAPEPGVRSYDGALGFRWAATEEAHGYVLQLSTTEDFSQGLIERRMEALTAHDEALPAGRYHWRLASLDDQGKTRTWSPARDFRVQPLPGAPRGNSEARDGKAYFAWAAVAGAARYEMEVGRTAALDSDVVRQNAEGTNLALELTPGKYWWRVRGLEGDGQAGAWSQTSPLVLPLPAPVIRESIMEKEHLRLSLHAEGAQGYTLEMATDPEFRQVLQQTRGTTPILLARPEPGEYYLRARTEGEDGLLSPPGPVYKLTVQRPFVPWWLWPLMFLPAL